MPSRAGSSAARRATSRVCLRYRPAEDLEQGAGATSASWERSDSITAALATSPAA